MDHLYDNPDMSDLTIYATDNSWSWGQTSKEFIVRYNSITRGSLRCHCRDTS